MIPITECGCLSADHHGEPGVDYFATVTDGRRSARLAGPFEHHRDAMAALQRERPDILRRYAEAAFYQFGTAGVAA